MKVLVSATLVLAILASLSDAQQQRRPQQRRRPAQGQGRRTAQAQGGNRNTELVTLNDGTRVRVKNDITLSDITDQNLNQFMNRKAAVRLLVDCFKPRAVCKFKTARALVADVRKLGKGGVCGGDVCTNGQEKAKVERLVKRAIAIMQKKHVTEWKQLIPNIVFLL